MNESDTAAVLLAREIEMQSPGGWSPADANRATDEARRAVGENAGFEAWLVQRARWIVARAGFQHVLKGPALVASRWTTVATAVCVVALALGVASDAIGPAHRINILAPPLLALLAWNIAVYGLLAMRRLGGRDRSSDLGFMRRALGALVTRGLDQAVAAKGNPAIVSAFARAWASGSRALVAARGATILHAAAAALALGALLSMYLRGLALEYRAGWESTFLDATHVHGLLSLVLGPASRLGDIALPGVDQLAALRFSVGPGENAARWIHLYAITLLLVVILPRTIMALAAARHARRLAQRSALPRDDAYFERLQRTWSGQALAVQVLPYSYRLDPAQTAALRTELERSVAPRIELSVLDTAPLGAEDDLARWLGPAPAKDSAQPLLVVLFALTATPEREHHAALLGNLSSQHPDLAVRVFIDESGFRQRFQGMNTDARLDERRGAWRAVLANEGVTPVFVDLERGAS